MNKFVTFLFPFSFLLYSCSNVSSQVKLEENPKIKFCENFRIVAAFVPVKPVPPYPYCDRFLIVNANKESEGVKAEYKWLKENYPGYVLLRQDLVNCNNLPVDILTIGLPDGSFKQICFDIKSFFGKF